MVGCCNLCEKYIHEEIGDSDFCSVYSEEASCSDQRDIDFETEEPIKDFDRSIERSCCSFDFWKMVEMDALLKSMFNDEMSQSNGKSFSKALEYFKKNYQ